MAEMTKVPTSGSIARKQKIEVGVEVDTEQLQDAADLIDDICAKMPSVTIRNNDQVNVTINYYAERIK